MMTRNDETQIDVSDLSPPVAALVRISQDLIGLLNRETSLLLEKRPKELETTSGEKSRLIVEYRKAIGIIRVNEDALLGPTDSGLRRYIKQITEALREALKDHARMVVRLKTVTEGLVRAIGDEVAKKNSPVPAYGQTAAIKTPKGANPTSIALDERI